MHQEVLERETHTEREREREREREQYGGILRQVKFAVVNLLWDISRSPLDFVWYPLPESTMCTAGV